MEKRNLLSEHYILKTSTCWEWRRTIEKGYGRVGWKGKMAQAHRVIYEIIKGEIPKGLTLDHLCRNRKCVNPDHLEPVSLAENIRRAENANKIKSACKRGHLFTEENTRWYRGGRVCRECQKIRKALSESKLKNMQFNKSDIERARKLVGNGEVRETLRRNLRLTEDTDILVFAIEKGLIEMNKEAN